MISTVKKTCVEAEEACKADGAHLTSVIRDEENKFLTALIKSV